MSQEPEISKWTSIQQIAKRLGVSDWAVSKWRQRGGVPAKWQIQIVQASDGALTLDDFVQVTAPEQEAAQ